MQQWIFLQSGWSALWRVSNTPRQRKRAFTNEKTAELTEKGKTFVLSNVTVFVPLKGLINFEEEIKRLEQEIVKLENEIKRCNNMLNNPNFVSKAPEAKIAQERAKLEDYTNKLQITKERLEEMK